MNLSQTLFTPDLIIVAFAVAALGGVVKGAVGFGMPMIMISGLSTILAPELALAALIIPTLITNMWQAFRQGIRAAWGSVAKFQVFLIVGGVVLIASAQLVLLFPRVILLLIIGVPVTLYAVAALVGKSLSLASNPSQKVEAAIGAVAGFLGGISGVWGPPTVAMLTARGTEKIEQMRVQGVIYGLGALALFGAHLLSGVLNTQTLPFSAILTVPALLGMWVGLKIQDRIDQATFRKLTLLILLVAGLNLIRRAMIGI